MELRPDEQDPETIAIWRDGQQIGMLCPDGNGVRLIMGDCDPGGGIVLHWMGEPFSMRFQFGDSDGPAE